MIYQRIQELYRLASDIIKSDPKLANPDNVNKLKQMQKEVSKLEKQIFQSKWD